MRFSYIIAGITGGFATVTCCIAPVVLVLMGFSTALGMAVMHQFHAISLVSGVILLAIISAILVKKHTGSCTLRGASNQWRLIVMASAIMVISWFIINYGIVAPIATHVYGNLPVTQKPFGNMEEMSKYGMTMPAGDSNFSPEYKGIKKIVLEIEETFCGSCGPSIAYETRSVIGVQEVSIDGTRMTVRYDSNLTSKNMVLATIHEPYKATIIEEVESIAEVK